MPLVLCFCVMTLLLNTVYCYNSYHHNGVTCFGCGPGTFVSKHCSENFSYSDCDRCPPNTFQTSYTQAERCAPCTPHCLHNTHMVVANECTPTSDLKCECKPGYHLKVIDEFSKLYECEEHSSCLPGQVITKRGTPTSDNECDYCPTGQFYNSLGQCETCTTCAERNMTQLAPCNSTADALCDNVDDLILNGTSSTERTAAPIERNVDGFKTSLQIIIPVCVCLTFAVIIMVFVFWYFTRYRGMVDIGSVESIDKTVLSEIVVTSETKPLIPGASNINKRQRTFSDSSVVSVRPVSTFPDLPDPEVWKLKVFDLLSQRLTNWKRFMRLLPGNDEYRSSVTSRCKQIQMEIPYDVPEQIHRALIEWSQRNDHCCVKLDSILDTLEKTSEQEDNTLYGDVLSLCCKLASEQKIGS